MSDREMRSLLHQVMEDIEKSRRGRWPRGRRLGRIIAPGLLAASLGLSGCTDTSVGTATDASVIDAAVDAGPQPPYMGPGWDAGPQPEYMGPFDAAVDAEVDAEVDAGPQPFYMGPGWDAGPDPDYMAPFDAAVDDDAGAIPLYLAPPPQTNRRPLMIEYLKRLGYYPRNVVWELTLACNLRCRHCGSRAGKARDDELSREELLDVADQLVALGAERVTLSGGEPTLSPHWQEVGKRLTDAGVRVNIISNGKTWSAKHTQMAKDAGLESAAFSLDGLEDVHDRIRKKGSFAEVIRAFDAAREGGLPTASVTHINKLNLHTLGEMRDLLHEHGVASWQLQLGNPAGNMADNKDLVIVPEDLLEIIPEVARLRAEPKLPKVFAADNVGYYGEYEKTIRDRGARVFFWVGCRAGCQVLGIESNGNIKGCLSLPSDLNNESQFSEGNLRDRSLTEIWCDDEAFKYNRQFTVEQLDGFCRTCRYNDICRGGCSWTAHSHTGSRFSNPFCYYRVAVEAGVIEP